MQQTVRIGGAVLLAATLGACAVDGGWMGAGHEAEYERAREAGRLAAPRDNRFYAEIHRDGRIHVFADAAEYERFRWSGRIARAVTAIGAGGDGQTVQFALSPAEALEQERSVAYRGAAQQMFEDRLAGGSESFYAEVHHDDGGSGRIYVFASWAQLQRFRREGPAPAAEAFAALGPEQQTVIVSGPPEEALMRFRAIHRLR